MSGVFITCDIIHVLAQTSVVSLYFVSYLVSFARWILMSESPRIWPIIAISSGVPVINSLNAYEEVRLDHKERG